MNGTVVDLEVDARLDQGPHVGAVEGVQVTGADLDSPKRNGSYRIQIFYASPPHQICSRK